MRRSQNNFLRRKSAQNIAIITFRKIVECMQLPSKGLHHLLISNIPGVRRAQNKIRTRTICMRVYTIRFVCLLPPSGASPLELEETRQHYTQQCRRLRIEVIDQQHMPP
ncbi:hypothetical protein Trydic_g15498 [Trypoxylus dichotomus]